MLRAQSIVTLSEASSSRGHGAEVSGSSSRNEKSSEGRQKSDSDTLRMAASAGESGFDGAGRLARGGSNRRTRSLILVI